MKKTCIGVLTLLSTCLILRAQNNSIDSLRTLLNKHPQEDTIRVKLLNQLTHELLLLGSDKTLATGNTALQLSQNLKYPPGEILALERMGNYYSAQGEYAKALKMFNLEQQVASRISDNYSVAWSLLFIGQVFQNQSNYPLALNYFLRCMQIFEKNQNEKDAASVKGSIGVLYQDMGEAKTAQKYYEEGLKVQEKEDNKSEITRFLNNLGGVYEEQNLLEQAEATYKRGLSLAEEIKDKHYIALISRNLMALKSTTKNYADAFAYGFHSLALYKSLEEQEGIADINYEIADVYVQVNKPDSAIFYATQSIILAKKIDFMRNIDNTYGVLAKAYSMKKDFGKAYKYQQQYMAYKDSLSGADRKNMMAGIKFQYDLDKKQSEITILTKDKLIKEQEANRQRIKAYAFLISLVLVCLLAVVLIRNNRRKQKDNTLLQIQKEEIQSTLTELKATQAQLIQSEKMASLGELTAGIAHEIQNPLNFVNNFSEVNQEMVDELQAELKTGNVDEAIVISNDIKDNSQKINHHGKRAEAIVKGMLQHSRASTGKKEPTDINALADEFLRLSYHGMRARDKLFNAEFSTGFDGSIQKINIVPQDIGRVLLNLFNNAFYAVNEKKKLLDDSYQPIVKVSTRKLNDKIEIRVEDNGNGIPQKVVDKIFQPFFTTKPTGQGTGLGLSLSYDIIKAHGGEIRVETNEGDGSEFIIQLPVM